MQDVFQLVDKAEKRFPYAGAAHAAKLELRP